MFTHRQLDLHPPGHPNHSSALDNLVMALLVSLEQKGEVSKLEEAIVYSPYVPAHPKRPPFLHNLAHLISLVSNIRIVLRILRKLSLSTAMFSRCLLLGILMALRPSATLPMP
jgi:hypothetical protein